MEYGVQERKEKMPNKGGKKMETYFTIKGVNCIKRSIENIYSFECPHCNKLIILLKNEERMIFCNYCCGAFHIEY